MADTISVIHLRNILLVTVPADPDDETISNMQDKVLHAIERTNAHGVILDIAMVETLDSFFARTITETAQMVAIMGGRTLIAGMQPCVAITTAQLGMSIGHAEAALDVERAFDLLDGQTSIWKSS